MTVPVVELVVAPGTGERLRPVARGLARWCDLRAPDAALADPAARLASSWRAPGLADALAEGRPPVALWVAGATEADAASSLLTRCAVLLCGREEVAAHLRDRVEDVPAVVVPEGQVEVDDHRPLTPFVRSRWRRRLGLAPDLVIDVRAGTASLSEAVVPTALAVAAVVVADRRWVVDAMALGAPVVTDARTAASVEATDGPEVVVADSEAATAVAAELAGDLRRCAALGRAARSSWERRWRRGDVAADIARRLGLLASPPPPDELVAQRLRELGTPAGARVAARARVATALFAPVEAR